MDVSPSAAFPETVIRVPPDSRVPRSRHDEMAALWRHSLAEQRLRRAQRQRLLDERLDEQCHRLRALIGADARHALALLRREILERHAPSAGRHLMGGRRRIPQTEIDRVRALLRQHGVEAHAAEAILSGIVATWRELRERWKRDAMVVDWGGLHDLYPAPDPAARNPWVTMRPPYWGWQMAHNSGAISDFAVGHQHLLDANAGQVGSIVTLDCPDASDISVGSRETDTQVAFWYQAPVAGLVEVSITAICGEARHQLRVVDEWGVSDAHVSQRCLLMAHVLHANVREPEFQLASGFEFDGDNSTWRDEQHVDPGQTVIAASLLSDGPVPAGEWVVIRAGVRCTSGAITNDMEIYSRCAMSWFLPRIDVRIRP